MTAGREATRVADMRPLDQASVRYGPDGLVVAVVQDAADGRVLMLAWQDAEAVAATLRTGEAHFHSRSRGLLWRKGETSGNILHVVDAWLDCDADAVLLRVRPGGPACHTGARSCFDEPPDPSDPPDLRAALDAGPQGFDWLEVLWSTVAQRARDRPDGSYTARLLADGVDAVARKVAEEAIEVVMAAKDDAVAASGSEVRDQSALAGELADLAFHALVLCAERGLEPRTVIGALQARHAR